MAKEFGFPASTLQRRMAAILILAAPALSGVNKMSLVMRYSPSGRPSISMVCTTKVCVYV